MLRRPHIAIAFIALIAFVAAACGAAGSSGNGGLYGGTSGPTAAPTAGPTNPGTTAPTAAPTAAAGAPVVGVIEYDFLQPDITVKAGTTVTWTNQGLRAHWVKSDDGSWGDDASIKSGESYQFTFATAGVFAYHCQIHSSMTGKVTVTP